MTTLALIAVGTAWLSVCRRALSGVFNHGQPAANRTDYP